MLDLEFQILSASRLLSGDAIRFRLAVSQLRADCLISRISLRYHLRIDPARRRYSPIQQERLFDLFDQPSRWGQTVRPLPWATTCAEVGSFTDATEVELSLPAPSDRTNGIFKYLEAIDDGEIPLTFLFSGMIFYHPQPDSPLQIQMISHDTAASFRMSAAVWNEAATGGGVR